MNLKKYKLLGRLTALAVSGTMLGSGITMAQESADPAGAEVLTRGPVHEAFAGTVTFNPEPGIIVDQAPPALIEEVPPEQRLEGDNVEWIPGYWAWDEDQNDFLWISGIWRNLPPGREWVPGYWAEVEGRHQWTSGYWEDSETSEVTYLPEPPRSVESGPNIEASSNDQTWVPGNWVYRDDRYAWRAGYWVDARENWSWTPAYYRWTQRGHVYVDGYWDYPVVRRGTVFAPVRFQHEYISRPNYYYTPSTVISLSVFSNHLFLRPNYGHYYFGDYYEPRYRDRGFYASYSYSSSRRGYDPIYSYNRWENRNDRQWDRQRQDYYEYRRDHAEARPPRTWAALNARSQSDRDRGDYGVADRFDSVSNNRDGRQRFQKVNQEERGRYVAKRQEIRKFGKERQQLESSGERVGTGDKNRKAASVKVNRSPVMAKRSDRSDKDGGPPARLQPRKSDKEQGTDRNGDKQSDRNGQGNPDKQDKPNREGDAREKNGKGDTATETRTKPGQKRESNPDSNRKANPTEKRKGDMNGERKADQNPNRKAESGSERKADQNQNRKAEPGSERKADQNPNRKADPAQARKANQDQNRKADPAQERRANQNPSRKAAPAPERNANPAPKRKAADQEPERKAKKPDENRSSAATPGRNMNRQTVANQSRPKAQPQPQRQQTARPQPQSQPRAQRVDKPQQKAQRVARPQQSEAKQQPAAQQPNRRATTEEKEAVPRKKKKQDAE